MRLYTLSLGAGLIVQCLKRLASDFVPSSSVRYAGGLLAQVPARLARVVPARQGAFRGQGTGGGSHAHTFVLVRRVHRGVLLAQLGHLERGCHRAGLLRVMTDNDDNGIVIMIKTIIMIMIKALSKQKTRAGRYIIILSCICAGPTGYDRIRHLH